MKNPLEELLVGAVKNAGKAVRGIGRFVRKHRRGLTTLALPLAMAGKADAEGLAMTYHVDGIGGSNCYVVFVAGASRGLDDFDNIREDIPRPDQAYIEANGSVEGVEVKGVANPPLKLGESSSESFNGSIKVQTGTVNLDKASHYLTWSADLPGCKVYINGVDAGTTNRLDFGTLTETLGEGEHPTASWNTLVEYVGNGNGGEPNNPPVVVRKPHEILIEDVHTFMGSSSLILRAKEGTLQDVEHPGTAIGLPPPAIVVAKDGKYFTVHEKDVNDVGSVFLQERWFSGYDGQNININRKETHNLRVHLTQGSLNGTTIFREYIPLAGDATNPYPDAESFPPYQLETGLKAPGDIMEIPLKAYPKKVLSGDATNYGLLTQSSMADTAPGLGDGRVDLRDFARFARDWRRVGNSQHDYARVDPNGEMQAGIGGDGAVNGSDLGFFCDEYLRGTAPKGATPKELGNLAYWAHQEMMEKATSGKK